MSAMMSTEKSSGSSEYKSNPDIDSQTRLDLGSVLNYEKTSKAKEFFDSFKRMDLNDLSLDPNMTEEEKIKWITLNNPIAKSLRSRHIKCMALSTGIGTGLMINSGKCLRYGGFGGLMIGFIVVACFVLTTCQALGELTIAFEARGGFIEFFPRMIDESVGFLISYNYAMNWLIVLPLELTGAALTTKFWDPNGHYSSDAWVAIFYSFIVFINCFPAGYAEAEFFFSLVKLTALLGFMILGIIINTGGVPGVDYMGAKYLYNPGSFPYAFKGVCTVFVSAAFSYAGVELSGLAAAESNNPKKSYPRALKLIFYRLAIFYCTSLVLIGLLVPYNDEGLYNGVSSATSPFVLAIKEAGIKGLPSVFNAVIMLAVLSVGNASVFGCSRTLCSLAAQGQAPKILAYIDRRGRPLVAVLCTLIFGLLGFIAASPKEEIVFDWLISISGLSTIFTWTAINFSHIRFRRALKLQGRSTDELFYVAQFGIWGSWIGVIGNILVLIGEFWISVWPIGSEPNANTFFQNYLCAPVVLAFYIGHKLWTRNFKLFIRAKDIDIDSRRRDYDMELIKQEIEEEKKYIASKPWYYRLYKFLF